MPAAMSEHPYRPLPASHRTVRRTASRYTAECHTAPPYLRSRSPAAGYDYAHSRAPLDRRNIRHNVYNFIFPPPCAYRIVVKNKTFLLKEKNLKKKLTRSPK